MRVRETLVVVGGSVGGLRVAQAARQRGYAGRIVVIDAEDGLPYDKPALSKAVLTGDDPDLTLASPDELARLGIDHRPGVRAVGLDPTRRRLQVGDGPDVVFTELVIATGSRPRRLPQLDGLSGVHYLRTRADALAVRTCFAHEAAVVVIGGGFIGAEVAASARSLSLEVTILEAGPRLLARALPPVVSERIAEIHSGHGVAIRCGRTVTRCLGTDRVEEVELDDGTRIPADCVVIGVGAVPATGWLASSGLHLDDGVVCDSGLQTTAPGVFAVGDVARWWHPRLRRPLRVEHWTNARDHAAVVARRLTGDHDARCTSLPYVWSDQYGHRVQHIGTLGAEVVEQHTDGAGVVMLHRDSGRVVGATGIDAQSTILGIRAMLSRQPEAAQRPTT